MADEKTIYKMKTPDGNPVRVEEAWKDANGEPLTEKVNKADAQTITGAKTFSAQVTASGGVKTDKVTSTNGTEVLSYDGTTTALKGKADRPTYNGGALALKSDVTTAVSDYVLFCQTETTLQRFCKTPYVIRGFTYDMFAGKTIYAVGGEISTQTNWMFTGVECSKVIIDSIGSSITLENAFRNYGGCRVHSVEVFNTSKVTSIAAMFSENDAISVIPAFDFSSVTGAGYAFNMCKGITSFLATGLKVSFNLSYSTKMSAEALRVVIDNIADVSELGTSPTLTLGSTNLAKLNADDITAANNKGWNLA